MNKDYVALKQSLTPLRSLIRDAEASDQSIELMREAMQEFVDRCDAGQVMSKYTYAKFKQILAIVPRRLKQ